MRKGRITLGLYNTYDRLRLSEAHRRAIARAGPLAHAFDMNLAVVGFPFDPGVRPEDLSEWIRGTSSIGGHGEYLTLVEQGDRILIVDRIKGGFPPQLGTVIATTSKPLKGRGVGVRDVAKMSRNGGTILLLFGLGPKGLLGKVLEKAAYHLDVTPNGASLETCTAMGAVAAAVYHAAACLE